MMNVLILGGGAIGCATAYYLANAGASVTVLERGRCGENASGGAAGILDTDHLVPFLQLWAEESLELFAPLCAEMREKTGIDPLYQPELGVLHVCMPNELPDQTLGTWLNPEQAHAKVSTLTPQIAGGFWRPHIPSIDARRFTQGLAALAKFAGVQVKEGINVESLILQKERVQGVKAGDQQFSAEAVIDCTGSWAGQLAPLPTTIRPIRGQILVVQGPPGWLSQVIYGPEDSYLAPKADGRILLGGTVEDVGFDQSVTAGGALHMLQQVMRVVPGIAAFPLIDFWAGLRPKPVSDVPIIGPHPEISGLWIASGHFRNGIILAPITGQELASSLLGGRISSLITI